MTLLTNRLIQYLEDRGIAYATVHHHRDYTAQQAAADTHTAGKAFAKAVVLKAGEKHIMAVIPAHRMLDLSIVRSIVGGNVELARERAFAKLFPDCEPGAEPPFGNLYGMDVLVSPELGEDGYITFNAGTHSDAIRMRYDDYIRLVQPKQVRLTRE